LKPRHFRDQEIVVKETLTWITSSAICPNLVPGNC
jgi:hypothetical protein